MPDVFQIQGLEDIAKKYAAKPLTVSDPEPPQEPTFDTNALSQIAQKYAKPKTPKLVSGTTPDRERFIPPDADKWSLNNFDQIGSWYRQQFGQAIPTSTFGQGRIHNSQGWDHTNAADVGLDPRSERGKAVLDYLRTNNVPFQAMYRAIKNPTTGRISSTGPHIHIGLPSHSTTQQYPIGTRRDVVAPQQPATPQEPTFDTAALTELAAKYRAPVPEKPETVQAQTQSMTRPDSPRAAVLITPGEKRKKLPDGQVIEIPEGTLIVDWNKARQLGIPNENEAAKEWIKQNGFANLLGKVEDVGNQTSDGHAVVARGPNGEELDASIVTTPEAAAAQARVNQAMHPGSVQSIERPHQVIQRRRPRSQQRPSTGFMDRAGQVLRRFDSSDVRRVGQPALSPEAASAAGDVRALIAGGSEGLTRRRQAQAGPSARPVSSTQRASTISSSDARALGLPQRTQPPRSLESGQVRYTAPAHQIEAAKAAAQKRQQLLSSMTPEEKQRFDTDVQDIVHAGRVGSGLQSGLSGSIARTDMAAAGALRPLDWLLGKEDISGAGRAGELRMAALDEALAQMPMEKRDSLLRQIAEVVGGTPLDLARLAALSKLPGGGVTGFAADTGLQAIGEHQPASEVVRRTASGTAQGALFGATHGLPVLGRAATVGGGSQLIASAMGETPSVHGAVTNALFVALPQGGRERTVQDSLRVAPITESNNVARSTSPESQMTDANLNARIERIQSMPKSQQTDIRRNELTRLQAEQQRRQVAPEAQPAPTSTPEPKIPAAGHTAPETAIPASPAVDVTNRPTATPEARQETPVQPPVSTAGEVKPVEPPKESVAVGTEPVKPVEKPVPRSQVAARAKREKISARTGLTPTQTDYLAGQLVESVSKLDSAGTTPELSRPPEVAIKVPGDGEFRVTSKEGANTLHQKITGKPIEGFERSKNATIPGKPRSVPPEITSERLADWAKRTYGDKAIERLEEQHRQVSETDPEFNTHRLSQTIQALKEEKIQEAARAEESKAKRIEQQDRIKNLATKTLKAQDNDFATHKGILRDSQREYWDDVRAELAKRESAQPRPRSQQKAEPPKTAPKMPKPENHQVAYNGKVVDMGYAGEGKEQFKYAAMRVIDNGASEGYILTPKGEVFKVTQGSKRAAPVRGEELETARKLFESKPEIPKEATAGVSQPAPKSDLRPGDRVKNTRTGIRGTVFEGKDGKLAIERAGGGKQIHQISDAWEPYGKRAVEPVRGLKAGDIVAKTRKGEVITGKVYERNGTLRVKFTQDYKSHSEPLSEAWEKAKNAEAGAVSTDLLTLGLKQTAVDDIAPAARKAGETLRGSIDDIKKLILPQSRGEGGRFGGPLMRKELAAAARSFDVAKTALKEARHYFDRNPVQDNHEFIGQMESGNLSALPKEEQPIAREIRSLLDKARTDVQALGTGKLENFIENYFPHIWEQPSDAAKVFGRILGKRPFEGPKSFLKKRTLETFKDGIDAGLKPISDNPVDLALLKIREMNRYIAAHKVMNAGKESGYVKFVRVGDKAPDGWIKINDKISDVRSVNSDGELVIRGSYYADPGFAKIVNNHLSPGLRDRSSAYRTWLAAGNAINQAQLGVSAFHLGFTSVDAMTSKLALGINQLASGKPIEAAKSFATTPFAPLTNIIRGDRVMREWLKPGSTDPTTHAIADLMVEAGGRAKMDDFYHTRAAEKMVQAFKRGNILGGVVRSPFAALDLISKPVMEYIVPRQKLGVFADLAKHEIDRLGPDATPQQIRTTMGKVWDSVDNRMGQLVYDNLFWNHVVKDLAMGSVRSVGWNLGTMRELGGAVTDTLMTPARIRASMRGDKTNPVVTYRMAYAAALPVMAGVLGATLQYLFTGERPKELKDYFFPRTGNLDENGKPERVSIPSYMKDVYAYSQHPGKTLSHKLHPLIGLISEMLQNKDYYGTKIRNEDDPYVQQLKDAALHVGEAFTPFAIRGYQKETERGGSLTKKILPFVGITPAPADINNTDAEDLLHEINGERTPANARTKEQAARAKLIQQLAREKKLGHNVDEQIQKAVAAGILGENDRRTILNRASKDYLTGGVSRLPVADALRVYEVATPEERAKLKTILQRKISTSKTPLDERDKQRAIKAGLAKPQDFDRPRSQRRY